MREAAEGGAEIDLDAVLERIGHEWEMVFDAIEQPVALLSATGSLLRLNRAALAALGGSDFRQVLGRRPWEHLAAEPWITVRDMVALLDTQPKVESRKITTSGGARTWLASVSALPDRSADSTLATVVYLRDLTEIERLERSLLAAERMAELGKLVAGTAHELRNPLFGISAIVDALSADAVAPQDHPECLELLRFEVKRLNQVAEGLLQYGKTQRPRPSLGLLKELIDEALVSCRRAAFERRVVVLIQGIADLPPIPMGRQRLLIAFRNLIDNAVLHAPSESEVRIQGKQLDDGWVEVVVRDHGAGFAEEDFEHLLQPFFSRRSGGTGLGLSIAANAVQQCGGTIGLENAPSGGGMVRVRLPCTVGVVPAGTVERGDG